MLARSLAALPMSAKLITIVMEISAVLALAAGTIIPVMQMVLFRGVIGVLQEHGCLATHLLPSLLPLIRQTQ